MVLSEAEIAERLKGCAEWLAFIWETGEWRHYGARELPLMDEAG
jgi:hypothetical protein